MLWIIMSDTVSFAIVGSNTHFDRENHVFSVWGTKTDGTSMRIRESKVRDEIMEIKQAIDYAISSAHPSLDLRRERVMS